MVIFCITHENIEGKVTNMKIDRINQIHNHLKSVHSISLNDLCQKFDVSKNTIRRDIAELEKQGIIEKVYGGIVLKEEANPSSPEPFADRAGRNPDAKEAIARKAAESVKEGDVIYIDSGTTTMRMIPHLATRPRITIVTASVHVINAAAAYSAMNVIATGGTLYAPSMAFVGPSVLQCLRHYNIQKAFLASTGISLAHGATNASPLECEIKQWIVSHVKDTCLLVDVSKLGIASLMTYCDLSELTSIAMDSAPPDQYVKYFKEHNVNLLLPD